MSTINTLLVGGGRMGSGHLEGIARAADLASVTAVVEPYEPSHQRLAEDFGIHNLHTDLDAALAAEAVDAVFICTPNQLHAEYALKCLRAGKHVFVEKPLALTVADADEMVRTAVEHDRLLMSGQTLRFAPRIRQVKQLLDEGRLGKIHHIVHRRMSPGRGGDENSWFARQAASGGILPGIGSHSLDAILWWLNDRAASVYAVVRNIDPHPEVDIEDEASLLATTAGGVMINVAFSFHHKVGYEWIVAGSEGVLQLSSTGGELRIDDAVIEPVEATNLPGEQDIHREFFSAIRDGRPLAQAAGADVRHSVALVCAAQESGRSGQAVAVS
jgi:predicted dehydrogenase